VAGPEKIAPPLVFLPSAFIKSWLVALNLINCPPALLVSSLAFNPRNFKLFILSFNFSLTLVIGFLMASPF
jgi:hypothetical protein